MVIKVKNIKGKNNLKVISWSATTFGLLDGCQLFC